MKISLTKEKSLVKAIVDFEQEEWKEAQNKAYAKLAKQVEVKGFRKGQAPIELAKKQISVGQMYDEAVDGLINTAYTQVLSENDLDIIIRPDVNVTKCSDTELQLQFDITVRPEVKLGDYKGIEVTKEEVKVSAKEVNEELAKIQQQNATVAVKESDTIENGDIVKFDFKGFVDGKAFEGGEAKDFELEIGSGQFVPGFEDQMIGLKKGEQKDIVVKFPEQYTKELAGKDATFKLNIKEISVKTLPELNDDLALDANIEGVSTLDELKKHIKEDLKHAKTHQAEDKAFNELLKKVIDKAEVEISEKVIQADLQNALQDFKARVAQSGLTYEKYLEITSSNEEKVLESLRPEVTMNLKTMFVLGQISKQENIKVEDKDIDEEFKNIANQYGMEVEQVKEALKGRENEIANQIYSRKMMDWLKENNKFLEPTKEAK